VLELAAGFLVAALLGAQGSAIVGGGVPLGAVFYFVSCLYWQAAPCWWPWCTARKAVKKGPGRRRRIRRKCWRCGGTGLVPRWGTRVWNRRKEDRG